MVPRPCAEPSLTTCRRSLGWLLLNAAPAIKALRDGSVPTRHEQFSRPMNLPGTVIEWAEALASQRHRS